MSDATQISEIEAIRQVIKAGNAMDYIDVVNEVQNRFRMDVSSAQVEQVYHELVTKKTKVRPGSRIKLEMVSKSPAEATSAEGNQPGSSQQSQIQPSEDELAHALHFVKSVHGLKNAKKALAELESILLRSD